MSSEAIVVLPGSAGVSPASVAVYSQTAGETPALPGDSVLVLIVLAIAFIIWVRTKSASHVDNLEKGESRRDLN